MGRIREVLLDQDAFAKPVYLNFRGRDRYATARGGVLTLIVYLVSIFASWNLFSKLITKRDPLI